MTGIWRFGALLTEVGWQDVLDISVVASLIFLGLHRLRTARARSAGVGLLVLGAVFILARQLEMQLTVWLLQGIAAVFILIVIVVFQDEIRRLLENIPLGWLRSRQAPPAQHDVNDIVTDAMRRLSASRRGGLIVLPGKESVEGVVTGGTELGGVVSTPLLLSLFDPGSPGHDGAVVLHGQAVARFGVHLPLSHDSAQLGEHGTRHAAALGLAERSDALIVVVSEETGGVSVAHDGQMRGVSPQELTGILRDHVERIAPGGAGNGRPLARLRRASWEAPFSAAMAVSLWLALIPGSVIDQQGYSVSVAVMNIPAGYSLVGVTPEAVEMTLSGPRRYLYFFDPTKFSIPIDATLTALGRREFAINAAQVILPPGLEVAEVNPPRVRVVVRKGDS